MLTKKEPKGGHIATTSTCLYKTPLKERMYLK